MDIRADQRPPDSLDNRHSTPAAEAAWSKQQQSAALLLDELAAAEEVVKWENEQLAAANLVHAVSPDRIVERVSSQDEGYPRSGGRGHQRTELSEPVDGAAKGTMEQAQIEAIANELAAAEEIVRWEQEQEGIGGGGAGVPRTLLQDDIEAATDIVDWEMENDFGKRRAIGGRETRAEA